MPRFTVLLFTALAVALSACGQPATASTCTDPSEKCALLNVKTYIQQNLDVHATAASELCAAAPTHAWSAADATAIAAMKTAWKKSRPAYEHVEGAIAVLYPELDVTIDQRYDGFLENATDAALFDDQVVTGNHAIERILFSETIPSFVVSFEREALGPKYAKAAYPATDAEANDFKTKLCARWATETAQMRDDFAPLALDPAAAYRGVIGSMGEQLEKVKKAASGEEESRYAQFTLADMRANLEAGEHTYLSFRPWLIAKSAGGDTPAMVDAAFARIDALYASYPGDSIPQPPSTWSSINPTDADKKTPFGQLFMGLKAEADDVADTSLVFELNESARLLGIPQLPQ